MALSDWLSEGPDGVSFRGDCPPLSDAQAAAMLRDLRALPDDVTISFTSADFAITTRWGLNVAATAEVDR